MIAQTGATLELDVRNAEGDKMTTLIERVQKWTEEERQQWREEGRIEGERELVYRLVSRRFGPGTAERFVPVLDPLADPECIVAVADAVLECQTAEEFIVRAREAAGTP